VKFALASNPEVAVVWENIESDEVSKENNS